MPLRTLLRHAAPYRRRLLIVCLLSLGSSLLMLALPWLAARMLGGILTPQPGGVGRLVALLLVVLTAIALVNLAAALISGATANRLLADLRSRVYEHLQSLPVAWHESRRQGDTLALMTYEVARLSHFLTSTLISIPALLLTAAGATLLMFRLDARLALIVPVLVLAFYLILKIIGRRLRGLAEAIRQAEADVVAVAEENLEMLPAIKAFTREEAEALRYRGHVGRAMKLALQENRIYAALEPLIGLIAAAAAVLLLVLAGRGTGAGEMAATELFAFLFYAALLTRPIASLAHIYGQVQTARGTLMRLQSVLEEAGEPGYAGAGAWRR